MITSRWMRAWVPAALCGNVDSPRADGNTRSLIPNRRVSYSDKLAARAMDAYDYVIVGGGTAGCVLANRLSADGRPSVLVLEAGPEDNYLWIHIPIGYGKTMFHPVYNWGFHTDPDPGMDGRRVYWPRGRGLGGSSSINGLIYVRGQPDDYDRWARAGNAGWG